jgi:hypothetical protein
MSSRLRCLSVTHCFILSIGRSNTWQQLIAAIVGNSSSRQWQLLMLLLPAGQSFGMGMWNRGDATTRPAGLTRMAKSHLWRPCGSVASRIRKLPRQPQVKAMTNGKLVLPIQGLCLIFGVVGTFSIWVWESLCMYLTKLAIISIGVGYTDPNYFNVTCFPHHFIWSSKVPSL